MNAIKLRDYQVEGSKFMAARSYSYLADDPGLGKTFQTLEAVRLKLGQSGKPFSVLVVCPKSAKAMWKDNIRIWFPDVNVFNVDMNTKFHRMPVSGFAVAGFSVLSPPKPKRCCLLHEAPTWDVVVFDEAHYLKEVKSTRSKNALGKDNLVKKTKNVILLSGSPVMNHPWELYPVLKVFRGRTLGKYAHKAEFARRFCGGYMGGPWARATHVDELRAVLNGFMLRRTYESVGMQMPPLTVETVHLSPDDYPEVKKVVAELEQMQYDHSGDENTLFVRGKEDGFLSRLRRLTSTAKVEPTVDMVEDSLAGGAEKILIFAYHTDLIVALKQRLTKHKPVIFYGGTSEAARERARKEFIGNADCRVFIGQIEAAGQSIDGLQTVCSEILFVETDWNPSRLDQAIKRVYRSGQTRRVLVKYLVLGHSDGKEESVDEMMGRVLLRKAKAVDKIMEQ